MFSIAVAGICLLAVLPLDAADDGLRTSSTRVLLISQGPDGHPRNSHEFRAGTRILARLLSDVPELTVNTVDATERPQDVTAAIDDSDAVVLFVSEGAKWAGSEPQRLAALQRLVQRQGGVTALHWAVGTREAKWINVGQSLWGGVHGGPDRKYVVDRKTISPNAEHPITAGLDPLTIRDEWYYALKFSAKGTIIPLWTTTIDDEAQTVAWAWERPDGGRSFGFVGLHFHENWGEETYRRFITRGVLWTIGREEPQAGLPLTFETTDLTEPRPRE